MSGATLEHRAVIVEAPLDRAIVHLGLPAGGAALLASAFLVVDTFWLGRVGPAAIAAASTAGFAMWLMQTLGDGLAMGSGAVVARAVGAADRTGARRAAGTGLALALAGAGAVVAGGLPLVGPVFAFMGTAPAVTAAGEAYLRIILWGTPAYFAFAWVTAALRGAGDARTPLALLGVAGAVNLALDPVLIFGLGPAPELGVAGAAAATVAAWTAGAAAGWWRLERPGLRPRVADVRWAPEAARAVAVGAPLAVQGALFSLVYILLTRVTTGFGTAAVAALGIGHKLEVLNYFVCAGMGTAATTVVGQALGAGLPGRARRAAWRTLFLTILPVGAVTALLVAVPGAAVAVFSAAPGVVAAGVTYVLVVGLSQPFMAAEVVLVGAFAGAHRTAIPATLVVALTAARVPLAAALVAAGWGVEGVWAAIAVTTVAKGVALAGLWPILGPGRYNRTQEEER